MDGGIWVGLAALLFGLATGTMGVLQWRGRLGRGNDPDSPLERLYLGVPTSTMCVLLGVLFMLGDLDLATTAAHTALHDTPDATYVTIIDTLHEAAVRVAER